MSEMSPITEGATPVDIEDDGFVTFTDETPPAKPAANAKRVRGSTAAESTRPVTKSERYINSIKADKDQTMTRIEGLNAQRITAEEEAESAIRQIEAERDAKVAALDDDLSHENVILTGQSAALEAAVAKANGGDA